MTAISIIIPTHNRGALLPRTLESVADAVGLDDRVEILVVDNGSTDCTAAVYRTVQKKHPRIEWRYFYDDMPGLLTGRHRGAAEARGEILAYLDDDVLLSRSWLEALRDAFRNPEVALVGGPSRPKFEAAPPSWLNEMWWEFEGGRSCGSLSLVDLGTSTRPVDPCFVWGLNYSIRKSVFRECGGFHPDIVPKQLQRYQGDGETGLSFKISAKRLLTLYHPGAAVDHVIPASRVTPEAFERRAFYQGVCDSYTRIRSDHAVPPPPAPSWKDVVQPIKRKLHRAALLRRGDGAAIRALMDRARTMGRDFHIGQVRADPKLLEWVLKRDYFDYSLPPGWDAASGGAAASSLAHPAV